MFRAFAARTAAVVGSKWAFALAVLAIIVWGVLGPAYHYSDTWQLVINTATTIITFLMVFLIQNTQNRDAKAIHLKLDELIRAIHGARTRLVDLEDFSDEELDDLQDEFERVRRKAINRATRSLQADNRFGAGPAGADRPAQEARDANPDIERNARNAPHSGQPTRDDTP